MAVVIRGADLDPFVPDEEPVTIVIGWVKVEVVHQPSRSVSIATHAIPRWDAQPNSHQQIRVALLELNRWAPVS